ncbi:MAG: amino acid deaminase/aldolase [bacterium]
MQNFSRDYSYYKKLFRDAPKPFAFVDLDLFEENIRQVKRRAGEKSIRVATKSIRCRSLVKKILDDDSQFIGLMCYSADEAVFLSRNGFDDILVAYPFWDDGQIEAIIGELKKGKTIVQMIDCEAHVERIDAIAQKFQITVRVCMDVDMSSDFPGLHFGAWRSGIRDTESALRVFEKIAAAKCVALYGIMGYEGQIAGVGDNVTGQALKNVAVRLLKKRSIRELRRRRGEVVAALRKQATGLRFVNAGGTGSLESSAQEEWVTEVTAGSGFFSPVLFDYYQNFRHLPAAAFAIEITRNPKKNIYTCLGGGYVASGPAGVDRLPQPYLPAGAKLVKTEGAGEVQTPIVYRGAEKLAIGDPVFMRHAKAGELCERFEKLYLVSGGKIIDEAPTYRGEGKCFL